MPAGKIPPEGNEFLKPLHDGSLPCGLLFVFCISLAVSDFDSGVKNHVFL
jgi:hypothetical protein